jgi:hypothetical protein
MLPSLPSLPRISQPHGAIAVVNQAHALRTTPAPRGMSLDTSAVTRRKQMVPRESAADHLPALQRAFLATRTVVAAETASEVPLMLASENLELRDAAAHRPPQDGSLPPRHVALTLLAHGSEEVHCSCARRALDALAFLANSPLSHGNRDAPLGAMRIRMSVLATVDAAWFVGQIKGESLESTPQTDAGSVDLAVRWVVAGGSGMLRTEFLSLTIGLSLDDSLLEIQNALLRLKVAYSVPLPDEVAASHCNVPRDAWAASVHTASRQFFDLMNGKPCVKKSKSSASTILETVDVFVRVCPRVQRTPSGEWAPIPVGEAMLRLDSFHAFLVGDARLQNEIRACCDDRRDGGLGADDARRLSLHTCGVQATAYHLAEKVTLYAASSQGGRAPGVAIHPPGSWVWRFESAIVPVEDVVASFYVLPCSRDSVLPGDKRLERPFGEYFNRAFKLYSSTFDAHKPDARRPDVNLPLSLPAQTRDPAMLANEQYALAAFNLDASSRRLVVGDAFAALKARGAPAELTNLMLQSSVHLGIGTSVLDAIGQAARVLQTMPQGESATSRELLVGEVERLKRVADAALDVQSKKPRAAPFPTEIEPQKVRALLSACGLRKGGEALMPTGRLPAEAAATLVHTVAQSVCKAVADETALQQARDVAEKCKNAREAVGMAICVLRASGRTSPAAAFVLAQGVNGVSFDRVLPSGQYEKTTPGAIVDTEQCSVVLLKISGHGTRVTATVRG